jgi:hypothetical protein
MLSSAPCPGEAGRDICAADIGSGEVQGRRGTVKRLWEIGLPHVFLHCGNMPYQG